MSPTRTVWLVTRRELLERGATKGFLIGTLVTMLIVAGVIVVPTFLGDDGPQTFHLGVVGDAPDGLEPLLASVLPDDATVELTALADRGTAATAVEDEVVDAALLDRRELLTDGAPDGTLRAALETALQLAGVNEQLGEAGLDPAQAAAVLAPPEPLQLVDVGGADLDGPDGFGIAFIATILLFLGIQGNGGSLLSAALEEKTSRVVEVLLAATRPWHLLAGKLIALTVLGLVQLGLTVVAALVANAAVDAFELPDATTAVILVGLVMLVVGFLLYASLYAVAGSMASTLEDVQSTAGPLTFVVLGAYLASLLVVLPNPDGLVSTLLTFVPFTAPFVVPSRVALDAIPAWQIAASVGIMLVTTVLVVRVAGRLYSATLLAGNKLTWREAWQSEPVR